MPDIIIFAGPNGAGKTTIALKVLPALYGKIDFVNADIIAKGLSAFNTPSVDFEAGRIMLKRLQNLRDSGKDFAFETTLSSKSFIPFLKECKKNGYKIIVIFVWLKEFSLAVDRVLKRKNEGGHFLSEDIVARRYDRARINFIENYLSLADEWKIYDNSGKRKQLIAKKLAGSESKFYNKAIWDEFMKQVNEPGEVYSGDLWDHLVDEAISEELDRKYRLNLPIVFMEGDKIVEIEGKDYYKYLEEHGDEA